MFDENKPIEYHYEYRTWCEAVLISYSSHVYVLKFLMPGTADCWVQMTATSKYFDKIRNVESTEMFDPSKPIEYHFQRRTWYEAVIIGEGPNHYVLKYRKSPTDHWINRTVAWNSFDKIRNVKSTEMFDRKKPIEYKFNNTNWCEAVLLDHDFNGGYLIKYRCSPAAMWFQSFVPGREVDNKLRNTPEKRVYRVVVTSNGKKGGVYSSKVSRAYSIGDTYCNGTVIGYHEGEFAV